MYKVYFLTLIGILFSYISFSQEKKAKNEKMFGEKKYSTLISTSYLMDQNKYIDSLLSNRSDLLALDTDTSFVADSIQVHSIEYEWKVFLIKGRMLPSEAEYHFYGAYKNGKLKVMDFFSVEVEIETLLEKYKATSNKIIVYGRQWDTTGVDHGENPPKKLQILLQYP